MSDILDSSLGGQHVEYRIRVDPAPDKRMFRQVQIAGDLLGRTLTVNVEGIEIRATISRADFSADDDSEGGWGGLITVESATDDATQSGAVAASMISVATRFSDAIRAAYPNAGLVGQPPLPVSYESRTDGGPWKSWQFQGGGPGAMIIRAPVTAAHVEEALERDVGLTEKLLGQAGYWAMHADTLDPESAVLFAAIAAETHAKRIFTAHLATLGQTEIADIMFGPRPPFKSADLYHLVARAMFKRSYKDDHPQAFKLIERLFSARNDVAHRGLIRSTSRKDAIDLARQCSIGAGRATKWLSRVSEDASR